MASVSLRRKARQFGKLVRHSALTPRTGQIHKPVLTDKDHLGITFIGHSSFFLQIAGKRVVIDPNFARWLVVLKRLRRPGVRVQDLPAIDFVLVTHAHLDHLHRPSLRAIARLTRRQTGFAPTILVPRYVKDLVVHLGYDRIVELDWWKSYEAKDLKFHFTPARHWGARMISDSYRGFGGYVIQSEKHTIYHAGDTAYFDGFREIGRRLHPEIALMPIGAYNPASFRNVHTSPEDALQGFLDMGARWMIPMHYGTFRLSHEPVDEPVQRLRHAAEAAGVADRIVVLEEGKTRVF
jgi:L-ascorbate metabolism protein UlaG (beta-lactamase superfamily)